MWTPSYAMPPVGYDYDTTPYGTRDEMLAPCMDWGRDCLDEGRSSDECEAEVEECLEERDNMAREQEMLRRWGEERDFDGRGPDRRRFEERGFEGGEFGPRGFDDGPVFHVVGPRKRCTDMLMGCFEKTLNMETCILHSVRCRDGSVSEDYACCPKQCIEDFKVHLYEGGSPIDGFTGIFMNNRTRCFFTPNPKIP